MKAKKISLKDRMSGQNRFLCSLNDLVLIGKTSEDGGPGSGNWGHEGRPGEVGGSAEGGGSHNRMGNKQEGFTSFSKNKKKFATPHKADFEELEGFAAENTELGIFDGEA